MEKLAILITHPIQYYVPVFRLLAQHCDLKVFYSWGEAGLAEKYDPDFKQHIAWDVPLLEGYAYEALINTAKNPGSHHFKGIQNPNVISAIENFKPDALLIYGWAYQSHLQAIRYFKGKIPLWFRGDSTLLNDHGSLKNLLRKMWLKWVYNKIDFAIYVGSANKDYFKHFGLKNHQLLFAPHAIDNIKFGNLIFNNNIRKKFNISETDFLILFAGKIEANKNPLLLLQAFSELNLNNSHLLFVGNGILEGDLKDSVNTKQLKHVYFMDFQNQSFLPEIYQSADLFCLPSNSETWGLAVNEAMAAGKAVLVSDKVGCAIDLVDESNGAIFKHNDLNDLKNKLTLLTANKTLLLQKGLKSKEKIQNWSFEIQAEAILNALKSKNAQN